MKETISNNANRKQERKGIIQYIVERTNRYARLKAIVCFFVFMLIVLSGAKAQQVDSILWDSNKSVPKIDELPLLGKVKFHVIKKRQKEIDQYNFLHGVALAWHKEKLYASFGFNKGDENTASEEAGYCYSCDNGQSWFDVGIIDSGDEKNLAVSHGVFLSSKGKLWAFHGSFYNQMEHIHMRAYLYDEKIGEWQKKGIVAEHGFWPMDEPILMDDGNWIIGGISVGKTTNIHGPNQSAVAISHGSNLLKWDVVKINKGDGVGKIWGESSNIVKGNTILNISRYGKKKALIAQSDDFGRTWIGQYESNLPMATSKPYCGVLSTGHNYLVCNTASDIKARRPLTIAIGQPGETFFSSVFCIRNEKLTCNNVESSPNSALSYPYAIEHEGKLYVAYSNDGGRGKNLNSAELAIIPISELIKSGNEVYQNLIINGIPDTVYYDKVDEGHLQGMASDYKSALYWSNTALLVKP